MRNAAKKEKKILKLLDDKYMSMKRQTVKVFPLLVVLD